MKLNNFFKLLIALIVSGLAGIIGGLFITPAAFTWYSQLTKPAFTPNNLTVIIVWIILYILMAVAAFLIWRRGLGDRSVKLALVIFIFQLIANAFWLIIFFGTHNTALAFMEIISLWFAVLALILAFYEILPLAAYLLLPYIIWLTFTAYLNYAVWQAPVRVSNISAVSVISNNLTNSFPQNHSI